LLPALRDLSCTRPHMQEVIDCTQVCIQYATGTRGKVLM
jgi:hypothetical protein